jgi:hypothetical protein
MTGRTGEASPVLPVNGSLDLFAYRGVRVFQEGLYEFALTAHDNLREALELGS